MQSSNHGATAGLREHLERRGQLAAAPTGSQRTHIDAGEAALVRIEKAAKQTFSDWLLVGHALCDLQTLALNLSGANQPVGKAYNAAYIGLMEPLERLRELDKGTASRARWMWDNHDAIEEWHGNLGKNEATEINHPRVVKERFEKHLKAQQQDDSDTDDDEVKERKTKKPSAAELLQAELERVRAELEQANAYIRELQVELTRLEEKNQRLKTPVKQPYLANATKQQTSAGLATKRSAGRPLKYPELATLKVGESFVLDKPQSILASAASSYGKTHGKYFTTKKVDVRTEVTRVA